MRHPERSCGCGLPSDLRSRCSRSLSSVSRLRRQDFQGCEACRPAGRTTDQVRTADQPEDRKGARHHCATDTARPRRRGDRMRRREFITLLGGTFAAWLLPTSAQPKSPAVVGFLGIASDNNLSSAFETRLRDLGWILGQNLLIEYRWAEGDLARLPALVDELVRLK